MCTAAQRVRIVTFSGNWSRMAVPNRKSDVRDSFSSGDGAGSLSRLVAGTPTARAQRRAACLVERSEISSCRWSGHDLRIAN